MRAARTVLTMAIASMVLGAGACSKFSGDSEAPPPVVGDDGGPDVVVVDPPDGTTPEEAGDTESGVPLVPPTVLAMGYGILRGVAADDTNVFFVENQSGKVYAVPLAGGTVVDFAAEANVAPTAVVVLDGNVIWSDFGHKTLKQKAAVGGGAIKTISLTSNTLAPGALAVRSPDTLVVTALDGINHGDVEQYTSTLGFVRARGMTFLNPYDVTAWGETLYWTESESGKIWQGPIDPTGATVLFDTEPDCQSIAANDKAVFWARPTMSTVRAFEFGTLGPVNLSTMDPGASSLAADADHVYWLTSDGKLRRASGDPGVPPQTLAKSQATAFEAGQTQAIALTSQYVVWITSDGKVLRLDK